MIEVFSEISKRMIRAVMLHAQLTDYFDFLDLHGYKRWHEYRFFAENAELRGVHRYAINHCNRLIPETSVDNPRMIPSNWENYTRFQVDNSTRKSAVKEAFEKWYQWENETKMFLESQFKTLAEASKIADADKVNEMICGVDQELKELTRELLSLRSVDYDPSYIMMRQGELHEKYREEEKKIGVDIC